MAIKYRFRFYINWLSRDHNQLADALSKLDIVLFKQLCNKYNNKYTDFPMLFERPHAIF